MKVEQAVGPEGWVDHHGDCLYRYAILRLRSPELAADVVQETFVEAIGNRESFAGRSSERTWLVGILKHKVADHFRRSRRSPSVAPASAPVGPPQDDFDHRGHWRVVPASWAGEPSREIESREFREVLADCLARLPGSLSEAFLMRELEGIGSEEIRQRLGITSANLWTRLHRSRSLLRRCLEENWFGDRPAALDPSARDAKGSPRP
jgi:RNA polymerase sigma-70 factor, ECF subfamily